MAKDRDRNRRKREERRRKDAKSEREAQKRREFNATIDALVRSDNAKAQTTNYGAKRAIIYDGSAEGDRYIGYMQTPYDQKPEIKLVSLTICINCFDEPDKVIDAFLAKSSER